MYKISARRSFAQHEGTHTEWEADAGTATPKEQEDEEHSPLPGFRSGVIP